jgi:Arc/MetJ family transcription regulator
MRTTVTIDDDLLAAAQEYYDVREKSALINEALRALVEREAANRLQGSAGSEPQFQAPPRRRSLAG